MHNKLTKRMHLAFYVMMFALKYEHVSPSEGTPDGSSEETPTFEVEIKSAFGVTIELHLKLQLSCTQCKKSTLNNSRKDELEETLYVACEKKAFGFAVDGPLGAAIKGEHLILQFGSLCFLYTQRRINRIVDIFELRSIGKYVCG